MNNDVFKPLWTEHQYCHKTSISHSKARQDRSRGTGPKFLKIGRSVRYRPEDVAEWLKTQIRHNTLNLKGVSNEI